MKENNDVVKDKVVISGSDFLRVSVTVFVIVVYSFLFLKTLLF